MENITTAQRNKMAAQYGLLIGLIYIVITSGVNLAISNMMNFYLFKFVGYVLYVVMLGIFANRIKKANGGYIEFREVFGAVFIMILIAATISFLYSFLYIFVIDPHFLEKMKTATLTFMQKFNLPDQKMEEATQNLDKQMDEARHFSLGRNLLGLLGSYILDSLFGLIVAAIVKKSRPVSG